MGKGEKCCVLAPPPFPHIVFFSPGTNSAILAAFNSLPNDQILDVTKLKAFADDKINVAQMLLSVFDKIENVVGEGENAGCQHFLLFPQGFQKASFLESLRVWIVW